MHLLYWTHKHSCCSKGYFGGRKKEKVGLTLASSPASTVTKGSKNGTAPREGLSWEPGLAPNIGKVLAYSTQAKVQAETGSIYNPVIIKQVIGDKSGPRSGWKPKEHIRNGREHVPGHVWVP